MNATAKTHRSGVVLLLRLLIISSFVFSTSYADYGIGPTPLLHRADVALSWMNLQLRLVRTTPVTSANVFGRPFAYAGGVGYESVVPGMIGYKSLAGQLNGLTGLPATDKRVSYN